VELHLHPTYLPSWREEGKLLFFASVSQIFRSCGLHGALLKFLTDGLNVGRLSKSDAGTHSWLPLLTAVRGVIEIMPLESAEQNSHSGSRVFQHLSALLCTVGKYAKQRRTYRRVNCSALDAFDACLHCYCL